MAGNEAKSEDNILSNLIGSIILQIKPYQLPPASGNGKGTQADAASAVKGEIKAPAAENEPKALAAKHEALPRNGIFKWLPLRRNGNGGEAAKQPVAMKK